LSPPRSADDRSAPMSLADACVVNLRAVAAMVMKMTMDLRSSQSEEAFGSPRYKSSDVSYLCFAVSGFDTITDDPASRERAQ
jgi:hypothetical protein